MRSRGTVSTSRVEWGSARAPSSATKRAKPAAKTHMRSTAGDPSERVPADVTNEPEHAAPASSAEDLATRDAQLAAIFESMADAVIFYDRTGRFVKANPAFHRLLGLEARPDYTSPPLAERGHLLNPHDEHGAPLPEEQWLPFRVLRGEVLTGTNAVDFMIRPFGGHDVLLNGSGSPVRDAAGNVVGCVLILRDVTERRQQERQAREAAREAEARAGQLEAILETMADGVLVIDREGRILQTNAADTQILRFDRRPGGTPRSLHERAQLVRVRDESGHSLPEEEWPTTHVLRGETLRGADAVDMLVQALDGRDLLLNVSGAPTHDPSGQVVGGVMILRDVTQRRRLERQTHEALTALLAMAETLVSDQPSLAHARRAPAVGLAQRLAELIRTVLRCERVTIVPIGPDDAVQETWATAGPIAAEEAQQWQMNWPRPDRRHLQDFLPPDIIARLQLHEVIPVDRRQPPFTRWPNPLDWRSMLLVPMSLGRQFVGTLTLDYGAEPHTFAADELALAGGVARLATLVLERERLLREREEARASALALEEANRRMDEFLGIATHELRTPVTSSGLTVGLAALRLASVLDQASAHGDELAGRLESIQELLVRADSSMERLSRLVSDLLDVSRIRAGRLEMRMTTCDLATVVREAVAEQQQIAPDRAILLHIPDTGAVSIVADADRIGQVVTNYLTNALKYAAADRPVGVRLRVRQAWAHVAVRDEGSGVPRAEQRRIWERFHRVAGTSVVSGTGIGLGLGLHICKTIIERHGGRVGLWSVPGKGSTFWFALPLAPAGVDDLAT
jgi:signal transduction histidine kinase/PAS domain-containing protein